MTERIPEEIFDAAHRRLCRLFAAQLAAVMARNDVSFDDIDVKLGWDPGGAQDAFLGLMTGKTLVLREISDLAVAMDCTPVIELEIRHECR